MSIVTLINRPCTLTRHTGDMERNAYGNETTTADVVATVCELQQQQRDETDADTTEVSRTKWTAFFPPTVDVKTTDTLTVDGVDYEFDGDPWVARNPRTQAASHIEATVVRVAAPDDDEDGGS